MTPKQRELLDYIENYIAKNRYAPTFAEMKIAMSLHSASGIDRLLTGLERQGHLERDPNRARGIQLSHVPPIMPRGTQITLLAAIPTELLQAELARRGLVLDRPDSASPQGATNG